MIEPLKAIEVVLEVAQGGRDGGGSEEKGERKSGEKVKSEKKGWILYKDDLQRVKKD